MVPISGALANQFELSSGSAAIAAAAAAVAPPGWRYVSDANGGYALPCAQGQYKEVGAAAAVNAAAYDQRLQLKRICLALAKRHCDNGWLVSMQSVMQHLHICSAGSVRHLFCTQSTLAEDKCPWLLLAHHLQGWNRLTACDYCAGTSDTNLLSGDLWMSDASTFINKLDGSTSQTMQQVATRGSPENCCECL
jgi:hypothetical protein